MTPGCSSKVRLTRSSNSRIRNIWVKAQIRRSLSSSATFSLVLTTAPLSHNRAELRGGRLVCALELLLDRQTAQLRRQHLDAPRLAVSDFEAGVDIGGDVELALAREAPVIDRLVDRVLHVLVLA